MEDPQLELRCTIIEIEALANSVIADHNWWLFFEIDEKRTRAKRDGLFYDTITVPAHGKNHLIISLFAWGRIKHELLGTVDLSVANIKTLLLFGADGNQTEELNQRESDFWFVCKSPTKTPIAEVRVAFELSLPPLVLRDRIRALLYRPFSNPASQEFPAIDEPAAAHQPLDPPAMLETSLDESTANGEEDDEDSVIKEAPLSGKLHLAYESGYASGYGSYGGQAEKPVSGEQEKRNGYVSIEDPVLRAQDPDVAIEDFNSKWQQEIEKLLYVGSDFSYETISDLTISFVRTAEHYAKTIVLELNSPLKTIQEIKSNGILGGRKYVVGGIFFKLAEDPLGIGGSNAAKIAGLDLKAVTAILNSSQNLKLRIFVPFSCVIDYLGYRLIAMAVAPLNGESTLVSGSQDGGLTIKTNAEADVVLSKLAKDLNLRPHHVRGKLIPIAVDTEFHVGLDNRHYLIDLSRAMPPEKPRHDLGLKHPHLFRVLRPELVRKNGTPLCSDAFSGFMSRSPERVQFDEDCANATKRLFSFAVPWAALLVDQLFTSRREYESFFTIESLHRIRNLAHSLGVNMRYLGNVFRRAKQTVAQQLLLVEMIARVVKAQLRSVMKNCNPAGYDRILEKMIVAMLNKLILGEIGYWNDLAVDLQNYFGKVDVNTLNGAQLLDEMRNVPNSVALVFHRCSESLGLIFSERAMALIASCSLPDSNDINRLKLSDGNKEKKKKSRTSTSRNQSLMHIGRHASFSHTPSAVTASSSVKKLFFSEDIQVSVRTKTTSVSALASGLHWIRRASESEESDVGYFRSLARKSLEKALENNPTNSITCRELAKILWQESADQKGVVPFEIDEHHSSNDVLLSPRKDDRGTKQKRDDDGVVEARLVRQFVALLRLFVCDFMSKFVCYARFLLAGGSNSTKAILLLAHAVKIRHQEQDVELLRRLLHQVGLEHEANLL